MCFLVPCETCADRQLVHALVSVSARQVSKVRLKSTKTFSKHFGKLELDSFRVCWGVGLCVSFLVRL